MTLYGYARVSVREPEDKNLDLQVERLVRAGCSLGNIRAGCSLGNIRAEEASGARNDRGGLLELLDLVVEGDTLVVTHIDRLSRGLTHGLQVIEGLHRAGVEFRSLSEDFNTATATSKLQLTMVLAFSEWWRNSIRERSVAGQAKARAEGRFPTNTASPCLQHILREKAGVKNMNDLAKAIQEVLDNPAIPSDVSTTLDMVRNIGNFSAHPNKSLRTGEIVDVEPMEAEWCLDTIEILFDFYFVRPTDIETRKRAVNEKLAETGKPQMPV